MPARRFSWNFSSPCDKDANLRVRGEGGRVGRRERNMVWLRHTALQNTIIRRFTFARLVVLAARVIFVLPTIFSVRHPLRKRREWGGGRESCIFGVPPSYAGDTVGFFDTVLEPSNWLASSLFVAAWFRFRKHSVGLFWGMFAWNNPKRVTTAGQILP